MRERQRVTKGRSDMTASEKSAFIAGHEANALPDNEIGTSGIPKITNCDGFLTAYRPLQVRSDCRVLLP